MNHSASTTKAEDGRERLIDAAVAETVAVGYGALSVEGIARRAGMDQASFFSHFADKEAAVEAAYECLFKRYLSRLLPACEAQPSWPLKVKVGIGVTLDMVAALPVEAQFVVVETLAVPGDFRLRVLDSRDRLTRFLVAGRDQTPYGAEVPAVLESALVGGIAGVISTQLLAGEARHLPALAPQLVELTLAPYLDREAAAEVATRARVERE
jgi:AcrR family transcriptional regulator